MPSVDLVDGGQTANPPQSSAGLKAEARTLHVRLLGGLDIRYGTERLDTLESPRLQSLLANLLLHREAPQQRRHLAFLLWPDSTEAQARTNLRQLLHHLRRAIPRADDFLEIDSTSIQWRSEGPFWLDVAEFEQAAARADGDDAGSREALEHAAALCGGDLLPECYDEWILPERERLRDRNIELLERLTSILEQERDYQAGARYAELLIRCDPIRESTYRRLMRLYSLCGDRARALRVYHTCVTVLERELDVEPSSATHDVYADLVAHESALKEKPAAFAVESSLVGRRSEWDSVMATWREASDGRVQLLLVTGEAGIGKTRLVQELQTWCARQGVTTTRSRSYAAEGRLAYGPVIEWLRSEALQPGLSKLADVWLTEVARLLPEILTENPHLPRPDPLTGSEERRRLFEALARAILVGEKPLLIVLDDVQWSDQDTLEFLHYLIRFDPDVPLLVACTARSEEIGPDHPVASLVAGTRAIERLAEIPLGPLAAGESAALAEQLCEREIEQDLAARLYRETEGNPLFLVESVRAGLSATETPPKVQSVIEARLAQLSPAARDMVGLAAAVGREFTFAVIREAGAEDEDTLVRGLDELWHRRIIREQGTNAYDFSHDKIREVAYALVGPAMRTRLHLSIARALESIYASDRGPIAGEIASHYERAGLPENAVPWYKRAAEVAQAVFANEDAIAFLRRAQELLERLPSDRTRDEQELELMTALGVPLVVVKGYGSSDARDTYVRARELCERLGTPPSPATLRGLALASLVRSELDQAYELGNELLARAEEQRDSLIRVEAHYALGVTTFWRGEFVDSRRHLEEAVSHYRPDQHRAHVTLFAQDPKVVCLSRLAWTLWYLGYPDQAFRIGEESLVLAEELAHPMSLGYALYFVMLLSNDSRDADRTEKLAAAEAVLLRENPLGIFELLNVVMGEWLQVQRGDPAPGIARMREGIAGYIATGQDLHQPYTSALLARAHLLAGDPSEALDAITEGFAFAERTNDHFLDAELHRLRAEALMAREEADADAIEAAFGHALEISRGQSAKALELRAALGLARWRQSSGSDAQKSDARRLLQEVYSWFTEGHGSADLVEAREFLTGA